MPSLAFHNGFCGNSVRCNPWDPSQLLVTAADNFGVSGSGKVYLLQAGRSDVRADPIRVIGVFGTSDGAFDACYSEADPNILIVACGDGVKLFNATTSVNRDGAGPELTLLEHQAEVSGVCFNQVTHDSFLSCSWDGTAKLWPAARPQQSAMTFAEHGKEVYEVAAAPRNPATFLTCSGDGSFKLWDARAPRSSLTVPGHGADIVLSIDWNKYDGNVFATGSVDRTARLWDLRRPQQHVLVLRGHEAAVRRVRFSPHARTQLASSGYDFRVCLFDLERAQRPLVQRYEQHREFVVGLEWSMLQPGAIFSASWDGLLFGWVCGQPPTASHMQQPPLPAALPPPKMPNARRRPPQVPGPMSR
jgi:peroxin-7